jgi:hypothetical protein
MLRYILNSHKLQADFGTQIEITAGFISEAYPHIAAWYGESQPIDLEI